MPEGRGAIYELALTHRSFAYEHDGDTDHNERLEFLGDSILGAIVTDLIFRTYPDLAEGEMARLRASAVNTQALADLATSIGLGEHIRLGRGEEGSGGRSKPSLLADTFEAVVGAVYVDRGIEVTRSALEPLFEELLAARIEAGDRYDAKTALQELVVRSRGGFPEYRVTSTGPDHDKVFAAEVFVEGESFGKGEGKSKKEAEHNAARAALARDDDEEGIDEPVNGGDERGPDARAS